MNDTVIIGLITTLCTAVATLWSTYVWLQKSKDEAVQKERDRSDKLFKEAQERSDKLLEEQEHRLDQEHNDLMFATVKHYEGILRVLQLHHGIDKSVLIEETKRITKEDKLSQSDITTISKEMRAILNDKDNDHDHARDTLSP